MKSVPKNPKSNIPAIVAIGGSFFIFKDLIQDWRFHLSNIPEVLNNQIKLSDLQTEVFTHDTKQTDLLEVSIYTKSGNLLTSKKYTKGQYWSWIHS